jgi:hypothetical protein
MLQLNRLLLCLHAGSRNDFCPFGDLVIEKLRCFVGRAADGIDADGFEF